MWFSPNEFGIVGWDSFWNISVVDFPNACPFLKFFVFLFKGEKREEENKRGVEGMNERLNLGVIFLLLHDVKHVWEMFSSSKVICPMQRMLEMKMTFQIKIECVVFYLQSHRDTVTLICTEQYLLGNAFYLIFYSWQMSHL